MHITPTRAADAGQYNAEAMADDGCQFPFTESDGSGPFDHCVYDQGNVPHCFYTDKDNEENKKLCLCEFHFFISFLATLFLNLYYGFTKATPVLIFLVNQQLVLKQICFGFVS